MYVRTDVCMYVTYVRMVQAYCRLKLVRMKKVIGPFQRKSWRRHRDPYWRWFHKDLLERRKQHREHLAMRFNDPLYTQERLEYREQRRMQKHDSRFRAWLESLIE